MKLEVSTGVAFSSGCGSDNLILVAKAGNDVAKNAKGRQLLSHCLKMFAIF